MKHGVTLAAIVFSIVFSLVITPSTGTAAQDGGYDVTNELWVKAILQVPGLPVTLIWREVGSDITPSGDQVISGYFYADPAEFAYGSQYNPEIFIKIYIATNGWCNIAFNHVTVDAVSVYSAHRYAGAANQSGTVTLSNRLAEHQYNGVAIHSGSANSGNSAAASNTTGYPLTSGLWAQAFLQPAAGPVTLIWKEVGSDDTPSGDRVVSGYFYASPNDFAYGSVYNPEIFVKIYIATNGWANIAFNHVTVDNVTISSAHNYAGQADHSGTAALAARLLEHTYEGVTISDDTGLSFDYGTLTQSTSQTISKTGGGSVTLDGAVLKINPGVLSESAVVTLYDISVPTSAIPIGDGAYGGQIPLSDSSYLIGVDRDVTLSGPITLTLPIDTSRLPSNVKLNQLHISTVNGGVIIPQGNPDAFDAAAGTISFSFNPQALRKDFTHQAITGPPMAAGFPFILVALAKWVPITTVGGALLINPFIATVDDVTSTFTFTNYETDHFNIMYRGANVTVSHIIDIAVALENAYDLFVTQMGFDLPNFNLDSQYTIYLDDLNNHYYFKATGAASSDGINLPGSLLFEGASYVNNTIPPSKWAMTAVHEYFHALQFGALSTVVPNLLQRAIYEESGWLFEGTTTALSGRVVFGNSATPSRDTQLGAHLVQGKSLFDPDQDPATDVAQDFFYYLEKTIGNVSFYKPMFAALELEWGSDMPTSVYAVDKVLKESFSGSAKNLADSWYRFIYDMAIENSTEYGGILPGTQKSLSASAQSVSHTQFMPPLSYYIVDIDVPKFDNSQPSYNQPKDVKLKIAMSTSEVRSAKIIIDAKKGGQRVAGYPRETGFTNRMAFEDTIEDLRSDAIGWLRIIVVHDSLYRDISFSYTLTAGFDTVEDAGYHIFYNSFSGSTPTLKMKNLSTENEWTVGKGWPIDLSPSGYAVWESDDGDVMVTGSWGKGSTLNIEETDEFRASSSLSESDISITNSGRLYYAGTYEYVYTAPDGKQQRRTNAGIVSCLGDGTGYQDVRFDYNESGGEIDSIDSFTPYQVKVAKTGRPIVFEAGDSKLGVVDTSGAGFRWLTTAANMSFSDTGWASSLVTSDNGERVIFSTQVGGDHHMIAMAVAGGTPVNLNTRTGLGLWSNGGSLSPDGSMVVVGYSDMQDVGIALIDAARGTVIRKISGFANGFFPAGSDSPPQFTPDGQFIVVPAYKATATGIENYSDIFLMKTDGTGLRNLTSTPTASELKVLVR